MGDTLVILPTYNERENISRMISEVLKQGKEMETLIVDDLSPDGTAQAVKSEFGKDPRVHLMERKGPRGRGFAGAAGFKWGVDHNYRYIVEMDADGSHNPKYLPALTGALADADVAICSRLVPGGGETGRAAVRRWVTLAANFYLRAVLGLRVKDCTTGYRAFRREALAAVDWNLVEAGGPAIVQEVLFVIARKGFSIKEIPFIFEERRAGESKLNMRILIGGLVEAWRIRRRHGRA